MLLQLCCITMQMHQMDNGYKSNDGYMCMKCSKKFSRMHSFKRHMQLHTGQFTFYCEICRKGFNSDSYFKAHMRAHQGLKYHCEYCSKPFMGKQKLKYHLSIHTGQYRFTCEICQKGFNEKHVFKKHNQCHGLDTTEQCVLAHVCADGYVLHSYYFVKYVYFLYD